MPRQKKEAYAIFKAVGLKPTQAINLFLRQVALRGGLPFDIKVPNAETVESMQELKSGRGKKYSSSDDLFKDLDI